MCKINDDQTSGFLNCCTKLSQPVEHVLILYVPCIEQEQ